MVNINKLRQAWTKGRPRICYSELGEGPPIVFLHGIGGNRTNWLNQQMLLQKYCTTISWDARGYGLSDDYSGPLNFSDFSHDLFELIKEKNIEKAHLVGLSMGARILMDFYLKYPKKVATLVLCDCYFSFENGLTSDKKEEFIRLRERPLEKGKTFPEMAPSIIKSLVGDDCGNLAKDQLKNSLIQLRKNSYLKTLRASVTFDVEGQLTDFFTPVQLIYGEQDKLTPPSIGYFLAEKMSQAQIDIIPGAGHVSNIEKPCLFNKILKRFILGHLDLACFSKKPSVS